MYAIKQLGWHFFISQLSIVERIVVDMSGPRLLQPVVISAACISRRSCGWLAERISLSKGNRLLRCRTVRQWQGGRGAGTPEYFSGWGGLSVFTDEDWQAIHLFICCQCHSSRSLKGLSPRWLAPSWWELIIVILQMAMHVFIKVMDTQSIIQS